MTSYGRLGGLLSCYGGEAYDFPKRAWLSKGGFTSCAGRHSIGRTTPAWDFARRWREHK